MLAVQWHVRGMKEKYLSGLAEVKNVWNCMLTLFRNPLLALSRRLTNILPWEHFELSTHIVVIHTGSVKQISF